MQSDIIYSKNSEYSPNGIVIVMLLLSESMWKLHYTHGIDFGLKNLHQATKKWLPEVVTTFQALSSVGDHKANSF